MIATQQPSRFTPQEYLVWEEQQSLRYEYFDGEVFAMTYGTLPHADIALNIASILRGPLRGRCKVRNSDANVGITDEGPFVYPDVSITCDPSYYSGLSCASYNTIEYTCSGRWCNP
ncbi:Uma2 family endonuclease [Leptothoe spongobia]|uniref:Uma2 family endonuclease n=1 Tax=Leptothoe spongobia TAU-MAC 1115 TaxID=1967444 RepID=A0A947GI06_9CYAN|nr:Uma2 family endonuclease [Leptothoe spongobia]MBT9314487.1 Uma2 family endonuclease [Leptothoe spongobia TAU-MAC 1115]